MIDRIRADVRAQGKELNEKAVSFLQENEESFIKASERYVMSVKIDEEGSLVIQFSTDEGSSAVTVFTVFKAVS